MKDEITGENVPAILVLIEVIRDYRLAGDKDGFCNLLFEVEKAISGEEYEEPKAAAERFTFRRLLATARDGIGKYAARAQSARAGAVARWNGRGDAAKRSPASVPRTVPRPAPVPPATKADGGATRAEDGGGVDIGSLAYRDPIKAALLATGETGNKLARNTFKKLLREKGERRFRDAVISFEAECRSGEEPNNRGAALTRRLKDLPDNPAEGGKA